MGGHRCDVVRDKIRPDIRARVSSREFIVKNQLCLAAARWKGSKCALSLLFSLHVLGRLVNLWRKTCKAHSRNNPSTAVFVAEKPVGVYRACLQQIPCRSQR